MARFDFPFDGLRATAHYRDDDLPDPVLLDHLGQGVAIAQHRRFDWTQHRHAVDLDVVLAQVVVQEADRLQAQVGIVLQLADDPFDEPLDELGRGLRAGMAPASPAPMMSTG